MFMNGLDLTGRIFGRLEIVGFSHNKNKRNYWKCRCNCGKERIILTQSLIDGRTKSCGCIHTKDLAGEKFGMLTAIEEYSKTDKISHTRRWKCRCDCGRIKNIAQKNLTNGKTTSCGCNHFHRKSAHPQWKGCGEMAGAFFGVIRHGAKTRKIDFEITPEKIWELFVQTGRKCALTGLPLSFSTLSGGNDGTASLDRIDASRGYVMDNVQWVHKDINIMKMAKSNEEFRRYCALVVQNNPVA
jgi:hypothetical protein